MKVSVVIPTYKRPLALGRCLEALSKQLFEKDNFEVIVVSDGPDPATIALVKQFRQEYKNFKAFVLELPGHQGPAAARNKGWKNAEGKLILFTDDDCVPSKDWMNDCWTAFQNAEQDLIVFKGRVVVPLPGSPTDYEKNTANLETAEFVTANCACSKKALHVVGGFDEEFTMAWREDSELQFRLIKAAIPIINLSGAVVTHPVRKAAWGISIREQKKSMFNVLLFKKHPQLYQEKIKENALHTYYAAFIPLLIAAVSVVSGNFFVLFASVAWILAFVLIFTMRRLKGASKKWLHVSEMTLTSAVIPFVAVYWHLYGCVKFKKLAL